LQLERPVNATLHSPRELGTKLAAGHHSLRSVLGAERLFVIGNESDLEAITGTGKGRTSRGRRGEIQDLRAVVERNPRDANLTR